MTSLDNATVTSLKKAVVSYKRKNLNQAKMRRPQLQDTLRALGVNSVSGPAKKKSKGRQTKFVRTKTAASKRSMAQRRAVAKRNRFNRDVQRAMMDV